MDIYTPYVYLVGWSAQEKYYYGVRFAKNCHPDDLWTKYFTSSKYVDQMREEHGEPDVIQVRRTFSCPDKARLWEERVLKKLDASHNDRWLNRSVAGTFDTTESNPNPLKGKSYDELYGDKANEWKSKIGKGSQKWWDSDEGQKRKHLLKESRHSTFTTKGMAPWNKITETKEHICPVCDKVSIVKINSKRKTCGSKSCAAKIRKGAR